MRTIGAMQNKRIKQYEGKRVRMTYENKYGDLNHQQGNIEHVGKEQVIFNISGLEVIINRKRIKRIEC